MNDSPRVLGNRYEVGDLLGRGGMAEVHLGRDTRLGRTVAIKLLRIDLARDATFQARFRREAQSAASLNHPAIVSVYDTGEEVVTDSGGGVIPLPYIVMEYVEGKTLRDMLRGGTPLDVGHALTVTAGVLAALEYSHKAGIVHRDIKPANVMVTPRGDVKVMDFGIARALADASATMTQTQAVIGTAQYLSPEQARGETVDARSDLYSAGCLLYELLTARPPFVADSPVAVAYQHVREQAQPPSVFNPAIPETVDRIVMHSLAKDRESRYQSAAQFKADLDSARAGRPVQAYAGAAAAAAAAATEYMPQPGTRAMPPVGQTSAGGGLLPGAPAVLQPGLPVNEPDGGWDDGEEQGGGKRKAGYAALFLAVLVIFGVIAFLVARSVGGNDPQTPATTAIPDVVNVAQADAEDQLRTAGFEPVVKSVPDDTIEKGLVISQDPAGKTQAAAGTKVTITVSTGPTSVTVPDVSGLTQEQARQLIEQAGLKVGGTTSKNDPKIEKDKVISTDPAAKSEAAPGDTVSLIVSTGQVRVPDFTGKSFDDAKKALERLGLEIESDQQTDDSPAGTVIQQTPAGVNVDQGSTVAFVVSSGPEPTPTTTSPSTSPSPSPSTSTASASPPA